MPAQILFEQLLTEELSAVTFVRDYIQLEFDPPPRLNVYSLCRVSRGHRSAAFGQPEFANLIIGCIGLKVVGVTENERQQVIAICLDQGARIDIPYSADSFVGGEALYFQGRDNQWGVWP